MPIRLRKRIKILPGVYINLSKSGISTSIGVRGASVTVGHGKTRTNVGIPGTGISYNTIKSNKKQVNTSPSIDGVGILKVLFYGIIGLFIFLVIKGVLSGL